MKKVFAILGAGLALGAAALLLWKKRSDLLPEEDFEAETAQPEAEPAAEPAAEPVEAEQECVEEAPQSPEEGETEEVE